MKAAVGWQVEPQPSPNGDEAALAPSTPRASTSREQPRASTPPKSGRFARALPSERADQGACAAAIRPAGNGVRGRGTSRQTSQERRVRAGSCSPKQLQKVTIKQHTKKTTPFLGSRQEGPRAQPSPLSVLALFI